MDATAKFTAPLDTQQALTIQRLRNQLISAKNTLISDAALLDETGWPLSARVARAEAARAQATLDETLRPYAAPKAA